MAKVDVIKAQVSVTDRRRRSKSIERKRVAAYCRVSTDSEDQLNSWSRWERSPIAATRAGTIQPFSGSSRMKSIKGICCRERHSQSIRSQNADSETWERLTSI